MQTVKMNYACFFEKSFIDRSFLVMEMTTPMATQAKITPILGVEGGKT